MPVIPSFNAQLSSGIVSQPKATAQNQVAAGLAQAGAVSQQIGNTLAEIKDKSDIVEAQLGFQESVALAQDRYKNDPDFHTVEDRFNSDLKQASEESLSGLSKAAQRTLGPELKFAMQAENARFKSLTFQRSGDVAKQKLDARKPQLLNPVANARNEEELEAAVSAVKRAGASVKPYYGPGEYEAVEAKLLQEGYYQRAIRVARDQADLGLPFDPKDKFLQENLTPNLILKVEGAYNARKKNNRTTAQSNYSLNYNNGKAAAFATGDTAQLSALSDGLRSTGDVGKADILDSEITVLSDLYTAKQEVLSKDPHISLEALKAKMSTDDRFVIKGDSTDAKYRADAQRNLNAIIDQQIALRDDDPAAYSQSTMEALEGESPEQFIDRSIKRQQTLSGDKAQIGTVLNKQANAKITSLFARGIQDGNTGLIEAGFAEIDVLGKYGHQALKELKLPAEMSIALDFFRRGNAVGMARATGLASKKTPQDINPKYKDSEKLDEVLSDPYVNYWVSQNALNPLNDDSDYVEGIINMGHKILASGGKLSEYFGQYPTVVGNHAVAVVPQGVNPNQFNRGADQMITNQIDFSVAVPASNADRNDVINELKAKAKLVSAPPSDSRLDKGDTGYYVQSPTGALVKNLKTNTLMIVRHSDVMSARFKDPLISGYR